jgi:hypothetical protein
VSRRFELWLDASDGSVITHDGVVWPDGTVSLHSRNPPRVFPVYEVAWANLEVVKSITWKNLTRVEWVDK